MAKLKTTDGEGVREFGLIDRISYAAGDFGCNMSFALKSTLAIFWTQYMGLEIWYSVLLIIVQVWDAINDPLIGSLIDADRRPHKRNKFVTYISLGSVGLLVAGALCFLPIPEAPIVVQAIIFVAGYVIWDAFYTVANVPYGSLLSLISNDPGHRASLSAWRSVGSTLGNMVPIAVLPFLIYDKNNDLIGKNKIIVTTEKDAMRLINSSLIDKFDDIPLFTIPIKVKFHKEEGTSFDDEILNYVKKNLR